MILEGVEVEELLARGEVDGFQLRLGPLACQRGLDTGLGEPASECDVEELELRILLEPGSLVAEVPRVAAPLLDRDIADLGAFAEKDLGRAGAIAGFIRVLVDLLVEIAEPSVHPREDQVMRQHLSAALA